MRRNFFPLLLALALLGAGLAALYNIFDPDRVILSGYLDGADNFVIENARAEANSRIITVSDTLLEELTNLKR